ncbi:MAG TPA: GNAT family N-acetyltransferase [Gemmatimonadaceae bacterium]|nr:GNAT family N-acetyltransferase [Gemmatimonadaceae bacterium]
MPAVGRLGELLVRTHWEFDKKRFMRATPHMDEGYGHFLGTQLDDADVCVLVAERDGEVVGYTYAAVEGRDWMSLRDRAGVLHDIIVDPAAREHGVGRLLLDATLAFLKERGVPRVVLSTAEQNSAAQRLFEKAGFRPTMIEMTREL